MAGWRGVFTGAILLALSACASVAPIADGPNEDVAYLFSSFRENGDSGLHLAVSEDGLTWTALRGDGSFMTPRVGGSIMRDPSIVLGPDGVYHMVWTTGWWENNLGVAHSTDLVNWYAQQMVPVMAHEPDVINTWAPEIFYDEGRGEYLIYWSSAVPGKFPETDDRGDIRSTTGASINHRVYFTTTKDFLTYTPTQLFYDGGFVSIDASILKDGDRYVLFVKDETKRPEPEKNIRISTGDDPQGPWSPPSEPFSPEGVWVEGPTAIKMDGQYYVYFDAYMEHRMRAMRSSDLVNWQDITDQISFPEGSRHGSILMISRERYEALLADDAAWRAGQ